MIFTRGRKMMRNNLTTNLAPTGIYPSYLMTIRFLLNGLTLKALIKMQTFSLQFWQAFLLFFKNVL
jgi:hypothetical protein